jgi:riboflavin kinase / FMN adenylyltransferase
MKLIRGLVNLQSQATECVATIGNFDGVHIAHQAIVKQVIAKAKLLGLPSCVLVFEPHPKEFFMAEQPPARLTCFSEKYHRLKTLGVDKLLVLQFNQSIRQMPAADFVEQVLIKQLRIKHLVVGDDFHFGHKRQGNYQLLQAMAKKHYSLEPTPSVLVKAERVSSTLIRNALANHDFKKAEQLLGRKYSITGKVGYGQQLGRQLNFPTANVAIKRKVMPLSGVFLVKAHWLCTQSKQVKYAWGAANCGVRPTVDGKNYRLEVHLLGVSPDLYGIELTVDFYALIRVEKKFDSVDALKQQIEQDVVLAQDLIQQFN